MLIPLVLLSQEGSIKPTNNIVTDYQTIRPDMIAYYSNGKAIRIDSIIDIGFDGKRYYSYNTLEYYAEYDDEYLYFDPYTNWIGGGVTVMENGVNIFKDNSGKSIIIKCNANVKDQWKMYEYGNGIKIMAQIVAKEYQMIFKGVMDSVKIIQFKAYNANGNQVDHPINNDTYRLSKNYGLLDMPYMYKFYMEVSHITGIITDSKTFGVVDKLNKIIGSLEAGDKFHYHYFTEDYAYDINRTILSKEIEGEKLSYIYNKCSYQQGYGYDTTSFYSESIDTVVFPFALPFQVVFNSDISVYPFILYPYHYGVTDFCESLPHFLYKYLYGNHPVIFDGRPMWMIDVDNGGHWYTARCWTKDIGWYIYDRGNYDSPDYIDYLETSEQICGISHDFSCDQTVSIIDYNKNEILIHPNPNNGVFSISSTKKIEMIKVFNSSGQLISNIVIKFYDKQIDLSAEPLGIYYLQIQLSSGELIEKKLAITAH
jgi:hypothetical protein